MKIANHLSFMFYKLLNSYVQNFGFPKRGLKYFLKAMRILGIADKVYLKKLPENIIMNLKPEEHIQQQIFWYGHYEKPVGTVLKQLLQPDNVFLDIGANIGYFSLLAARSIPDGKVVSFEPVSYLFEALEKNVSLNKGVNILPIKIAVGEKEEEGLIYLSSADNSGMSSFQQPENYSGQNEMVKIVTLDNWFSKSGLNKINVLKIDVEGNELAVLKGMKNIANRFKPHILLELNPETLSLFNLTPADLLSYAAALSYKIFAITEVGKLVLINSHDSLETINIALIHPEKIDHISNILQQNTR
jgi:FkbM family methyltransferase